MKKNPAAPASANRAITVTSHPDDSPLAASKQDVLPIAARRLAALTGLSLTTARAVCRANEWGISHV